MVAPRWYWRARRVSGQMSTPRLRRRRLGLRALLGLLVLEVGVPLFAQVLVLRRVLLALPVRFAVAVAPPVVHVGHLPVDLLPLHLLLRKRRLELRLLVPPACRRAAVRPCAAPRRACRGRPPAPPGAHRPHHCPRARAPLGRRAAGLTQSSTLCFGGWALVYVGDSASPRRDVGEKIEARARRRVWHSRTPHTSHPHPTPRFSQNIWGRCDLGHVWSVTNEVCREFAHLCKIAPHPHTPHLTPRFFARSTLHTSHSHVTPCSCATAHVRGHHVLRWAYI